MTQIQHRKLLSRRTGISCLVLLAGLLALVMLPGAARAACSETGTTATCIGDLDSIIDYGTDDGIDTIVIESLTSDFEIDGGSAVKLTDNGAAGTDPGAAGNDGKSLSVTFDGGDYGIVGIADEGITQYGFDIKSAGGEGATGEDERDTTTAAGEGGIGGEAGDVSLEMTSGFLDQTLYDSSTAAISVLSEGGTGGTGGESSQGEQNTERTITSGDGGDGGPAGSATVTIESLSNPDGGAGFAVSHVATGISVLSTGGDGGEGGKADCENTDTGDPDYKHCYEQSGKGGDGSISQDATLSVTDTVVTIDDFTDAAIVVTSAGGAGGQGGEGRVKYHATAENDGDYGKGGTGGHGDTASFILDGASVTATDNDSEASYGIVVSSEGGAGGQGNDLSSESCDTGYGDCYPGFGDGGGGGDAYEATVSFTDSDLSVSVTKDDAIAVLVESAGGEGGTIGTANNPDNSNYWKNNSDRTDTTSNGGDGGDGGSVSLDLDSSSTLTVSTSGAGGDYGALTLLSQGGDGGDGGADTFYGETSAGGAGGAGDTVTVKAYGTVTATTSGDDAYGLMFASKGGAGGTGYETDGSGGDGGTVDVTLSDVDITTTGKKSHGISAVSQGGAGGDSSSGGDGGDGGDVTVKVAGGTINVSGKDAQGIHAESYAESGGSGTTGTTGEVTVTSGAAITVSGESGSGIYVKSNAPSSTGALEVTISSGGSVTASGTGASAIEFVDGDSNTLTNNGTITTSDLSSSSIYALKSAGAGLSVTNNGTFGGSVSLADSYSNTFTNNIGGTLNLGASFDLGSDGALVNAGTMSPGGAGTVLTSTVTGSSAQTSTGVYLVDIDGTDTDEIVFKSNGTVLDGAVRVNTITALGANGSSTIASSSDGDIVSDLTVADTATAHYVVTTGSAEDILLYWSVALDSSSLLGGANRNQRAIARHLQKVLEVSGLGTELSTLITIVDPDEYLAALDTFASQISSDLQLTSLFAGQRFSDALLSCSVRDGAYRFVDQDQCFWLNAGATGMERSRTAANRPFEQDAWELEGGAQFQVRENWFLGTGFGIGTQSLSVDDIAESDGNFYQGGLVAKHTIGNSIVSASLAGGYNDSDITRYLYSGDVAQGTQKLWTVSGQLSASHAFVSGNWYLKPRIDVGFDRVSMDGFTERGAGGASLTIRDSAQTYYNVQPALEFGGELGSANGTLIRPSVVVGLTQFLGAAAPMTRESFADTPSSVAPFTIVSEFDKTYLDLEAGIEVLGTDGLTVSAQGFGQFSDSFSSYGGAAKFAAKF